MLKMTKKGIVDVPVRESATAIIEGRVDIRTIAALYRFFTRSGIVIGTKSMLVKEVMETLLTSLVENGMEERISDFEEAMELLFPLATNRDRKVLGNLGKAIHQQRSEEMDREEIRRQAEDFLKNNKEFLDNVAKNNGYISGEFNVPTLSPEAQTVPFFGLLPTPVVDEKED